MEKPQYAEANFSLLPYGAAGIQDQRELNNPKPFHLAAAPLPSTLAIIRPATPAATDPGLPCTRTSRVSRGCSAGNITSAKPSPGAFFLCVHGPVPVLARAAPPASSGPTALAVPFLAERAIPCKTVLTTGSRKSRVNVRYACANASGEAVVNERCESAPAAPCSAKLSTAGANPAPARATS